MYYFADWVQTPNGKAAAFPNGMGYAMLAGQPGAEFALFECEQLEMEQSTAQIVPVSGELADLLEAAKQYAPALALARDWLEAQKPAARAAFQQAMIDRLRHCLEQQPTAPYFMAQALETEAGYKYEGAYYWIVGHRPLQPDCEVQWVSRDFFVYQDPLAHFDISRAMLKERFAKHCHE